MHKEGFSAQSIGRIIAHYTRGLYEGETVDYDRRAGGGHIEPEKSGQNYQLGECHEADWVRERLKGVYTRPQDANKPRMLDIVVTLPADEPLENARKFFEASYRSLCKQFQRKNNIVGAWVHMDEAQPHMHFAFLPIVEKTMKKNPEVKEGISQKAYFPSKSSLQQMHKITEKDVSQALGHRVAILNEATKTQGGNKSISQLKTESKKVMEKAMAQKAKLEEAKDGISKGAEWFGLGKEYWKVTPERMPVVWSLAKAGAEAKATEAERQKELLNAKAKEKQADQEREAVQRQLDEANREIQRLREKVSEADVYFYAPEQQREQLRNYAEFRRDYFKDFTDCLNREAVRGYLGAGKAVEPVVKVMGKALEYIGIEPEAMGSYVLSCVNECRKQAKNFFQAMQKGQIYQSPERFESWEPDPAQTDFGVLEEREDLRHLQHLKELQEGRGQITKEKGNLLQHLRPEEKSKTKTTSKGR